MKKILALMFLATLSISLFAQKQVSGVVVDGNGEPIIGASIQAKGTTQGTISDYDGKFEMNVPESVKTLVVSFVGMTTQEVEAAENIKVVLTENTEIIQEVVVTGYGNVSKGGYTGSVQSVKAEDIEKKNATDITKALAGEVAGVQVATTSGQPGSIGDIRIRGIGSINAGSSPLYVVDGIALEAGEISSIDVSDIASTTILKDATATSLYGSRGANGVIVITTKKGSSNGDDGKIDIDIKAGTNMHLLPMYECLEVAHVENLRTNVEVQSHHLDVGQLLCMLDDGNHVAHGNAELILSQSCGDVGMSMCANVGVQTECYACRLSLCCSQFVDDLQFGYALYVETEDVVVQTEVDFPVGLTHTSIDNLVGGESGIDDGLYLASADAVGSQSRLADDLEDLGVGISLDGIVYHEPLVSSSLFVDGAQCLSQQFCIVVVEGRLNPLELLYREYTFHVFANLSCVCILYFPFTSY